MTTLILVGVLLAGPPASEAQLKAVEALWRSQREEVVSARIRFRFLQAGGDLAPLTPDQAAAAFAAADMAAGPDNMQSFVRAIRPPGWAGKPWAVLEFLKEGKKTRERSVADGSHDYVYDGELLAMRLNAGRQVTVSDARRGSKVGRLSFDLFRPLPDPEVDLRVVDAGPQRVRLAGEGVEYVVDPKTGLVASAVASGRGAVQEQTLTAGAVTYPGGVTVAPAVAVLGYSDGSLRRAQVAVIEEAEFNVSLPDDSFRMAAAAGTVIVDARYPDQRPKLAGNAISDVVGRLRATTGQPTVPLAPPREDRTRIYTYAAVGVALTGALIGAVWAGRRWFARSA